MDKKIMVVKYGSASVTDGTGMDSKRLGHHADQLAHMNKEYQLVIVSSGSVAVGRSYWRSARNEQAAPNIQTLAMMGSAAATTAWQAALRERDMVASQLLVTHREISEVGEQNSLTNALYANLAAGVIPIVNENDAISERELAKLSYGGDNDGLGSHTAIAMKASVLLLLTEAAGVLDGDTLVPVVDWEEAAHYYVRSLARTPNDKGRGGMASKIDAAISAAQAGIHAYIASAEADITAILSNNTGTHFMPNSSNNHVE